MRKKHVVLHPIDVVAFVAAILLAIPLIALIDRAVPGPRDSAAMLLPYLCFGFLPCLLLTYTIANRFRGGPPRVEERARTIGGRVEQKAQNCGSLVLGIIMVLALLFGLKGVAYVINEAPTALAPTAPSPGPTRTGDPAERAKTIARRAIYARISRAGSEKMTLEAELITRKGRRWWRVTSRGAIADFVVDVPPDSEAIAVFAADEAPPPDAEGVAPVGS